MNTFKAKFAFYWEAPGMDPFASYLVIKSDCTLLPVQGNVSAQMLLENGKAIPPTPVFKTWKSLIAQKTRCRQCWAALRSASDYDHHIQSNHPLLAMSGVRP